MGKETIGGPWPEIVLESRRNPFAAAIRPEIGEPKRLTHEL
jgi:hypothetical protein